MPRCRRVRMTRQAISPRLATRTVPKRGLPSAVRAADSWTAGPVAAGTAVLVLVSSVIAGSHPEEAEGGLRQGAAGDDVEGQAQYGAGIRGIDDGVVPQPRGGVVGAALVLVLLPDGS